MGACFQLPSPLTARDALQEGATVHQAGPAGEIQMQNMLTAKFHFVCRDRKLSLFSMQTHLFEKKPTDCFRGFSFFQCVQISSGTQLWLVCTFSQIFTFYFLLVGNQFSGGLIKCLHYFSIKHDKYHQISAKSWTAACTLSKRACSLSAHYMHTLAHAALHKADMPPCKQIRWEKSTIHIRMLYKKKKSDLVGTVFSPWWWVFLLEERGGFGDAGGAGRSLSTCLRGWKAGWFRLCSVR